MPRAPTMLLMARFSIRRALRAKSSCVCLCSESSRFSDEFSPMSLSFRRISFSVSLDCHASSEDICSFSAMVRLVVVSSWLSVILSRLAFVSRSLSSISFFSRSFSCTCLRSRSLTCVACSLAPSSSSRFFSCSCASRVCLYSMKVLT